MKRQNSGFFDGWDEFDEWDEFDPWDELGDDMEFDNAEEYKFVLFEATMFLANTVFLSDNHYLPVHGDDYNLGFVEPRIWWPLVEELAKTTYLSSLMTVIEKIDDLLRLDGVPSQVLEDPLEFLAMALEGNLPPEPTGRKVGSPKLVKIARAVIDLLSEFPERAQAAMQIWAKMQRGPTLPFPMDMWSPESLRDLLEEDNLPAPIAGFSAVIALSMVLWPERGEDLSVPSHEIDPGFYNELLELWQNLPDSPTMTEEGTGSAEALFAQGQLAHMLAETGSIEGRDDAEEEDEDLSLVYSRLSRAILWLHNQCRHCPERQELTCKAANGWEQQPTPLIDLASEIANTGHISGCVRM